MQRVVANPKRPELCPVVVKMLGASDVKCRDGMVYTLDNHLIGRCNRWVSMCQYR